MSFNRVILMGNLTKDPAVKFLPSQMPVAEFGLACNRKFRTQAGEDREEVLFIDCAAFGKTGEIIAKYFTKGKQILVEGRLKLDSWEDKQGGGKRNKITVVIESFQFAGGNRSDDGERNIDRSTDQTADEVPGSTDVTRAPNRRSRETVPPQAEPPFGDEAKFEIDEIPFAWSGRQQQSI